MLYKLNKKNIIIHLLIFFILVISISIQYNLYNISLYNYLLIYFYLVIIHKNNLLLVVITYHYNYGSIKIIYVVIGILNSLSTFSI